MGILEVKNVSIRYITGDFKEIGLKEYIMRRLTGNYHVKEFWADKDISFSLEKGDMLGICGSNGAGKSTLLKVISGIMEPTKGSVKRTGSIAALLELGSGFDGDLTVKENAYLRGAMLGYTRAFMDETYKQIIEFAELKNFEDRPFKQLSSGMKSRLAFSIASLVKPDLLILDEVLSVGDGAFKRKSEAKMREIISSGATTILVSHSTAQIRELCNKVLWLDHGKQVVFGDTQEICDAYEHYLATPLKKRKLPANWDEIDNISRNYRLYLKLSEKERNEARNNMFLIQETVTSRESRWMDYIDNLPEMERVFLLCEYNILPVCNIDQFEDKTEVSYKFWIDKKNIVITEECIDLDICGWAMDQNNQCPFKKIYLLLAGKVMLLEKQNRPDVPKHFKLESIDTEYGFICKKRLKKSEIDLKNGVELVFVPESRGRFYRTTVHLEVCRS